VFAILLSPIVGMGTAILFSMCNAAIHGVIDWNIWSLYKKQVKKRLNKAAYMRAVEDTDWNTSYKNRCERHLKVLAEEFKYWEDKGFYTTIGLDQLLHTLTIILLFALLI
jgi:hypothetical protein